MSAPVVGSTLKADTVKLPSLPVNTNRPAASEAIELGNGPVGNGDPEIEVSAPEFCVTLKAEILLEIALLTYTDLGV